MNLARFPRRRYTQGPTPIERLSQVTALFNGPEIYIKRDDLLGLAGGGNKTRKLEFLVADALVQGADTLITVGAVQSNHCRLTLAAAIKEGMNCRLVLEERVPNSYNPDASGNNLLFKLMGVEKTKVVPCDIDVTQTMQSMADEIVKEGRKAYIIPGGGSNPIGQTGYVACAEEIIAQSFELGINFDYVIVTSGSGGTHSGLLVGFTGNNTGTPVVGISIRRKREPQEELIYSLTKAGAARLGCPEPPRQSVLCFDEYVGPGYSLPTPEMVKAVKLLARTEGILLDPVYTGKAMAGMLSLVEKGFFKRGQKILFVHTGGSPALYGYSQYFN
jgi:D-cysteine desulfhydrase